MSHYVMLKTNLPQAELVACFVKHLIREGERFTLKRRKDGFVVIKMATRGNR